MNLDLLTALFDKDPRIVSIELERESDRYNTWLHIMAWDDLPNKENLIDAWHPLNDRGDNAGLTALIDRLLREIDEKRYELWGIPEEREQ